MVEIDLFKPGGLDTLLQVLFIALKLSGIIDWSWWIVLLPLIIGVTLVTIVLTLRRMLR
jgi:hypothetical protein